VRYYISPKLLVEKDYTFSPKISEKKLFQ